MPEIKAKNILLTGATGYVGGELLRMLDCKANNVRCLVRRPQLFVTAKRNDIEVFEADIFDPPALHSALEGIEIAFYLIHSMDADGEFESRDRTAASNFSQAAIAAGVKRIIYLGGLGDATTKLSPHLRSRHEVGEILRASGILTIELRASIVIGSGSLSFELLRALTERLPAMITPRWVRVMSQPIGIDDLLSYLLQAMVLEVENSMIVEIGGADQMTYQELMNEYARQRGLKRFMIPAPFLTPRLSGLWLGLVAPAYARVGRKLLNSIFHPTIVRDQTARKIFSINPLSAGKAITQTLEKEEKIFYRPFLSQRSGETKPDMGRLRQHNRMIDNRIIHIPVKSSVVFEIITRLGGKNGWPGYNKLWRLRGFLDHLIGGIGFRFGRPENNILAEGDKLDFWRVDEIEQDSYLRLAAELKMPGKSWLEFEILSEETHCTLRQTAVFSPRGLGGIIYWYIIYPLHELVFSALARNIAKQAINLNSLKQQ